jgi:hypothetical protein
MNCASAIAMVAPVTIKMLMSYMAGSDDVSRSSYRFQQGLSAQRFGEHGGQARLRHITGPDCRLRARTGGKSHRHRVYSPVGGTPGLLVPKLSGR